MTSNMQVTTPELLWHGGGAENGKPDPVYSVDIFDNNILATSGVDENIPPKGSVRLWKIGDTDADLQFLIDLSDHQSTVNAVRFSPCGKMIATASDRLVVIYSLTNPDDNTTNAATTWETLTDPKRVYRSWLRPSLQEIYDLQWSPDSTYIIAGSIDSKGEIMKVMSRDTLSLRGHSSYVQGVAWDPLNQMVVTQSSDRSCRIHQVKHKYKAAQMAKLVTKGNQQIRMTNPYGSAISSATDAAPPTFSTSLEDTSVVKTPATVSHLYADSTVPCFFRRPAFTPDGSLLITPTGIHRPLTTQSPEDACSSDTVPSFCTHVFLRDHLQSPIVSLVGLEEPSVAIRCCPLLFKRVVDNSNERVASGSLFEGDYRMIFAVVTTSSVLVYDTQHAHPIARIGGCHLATINDAAWSKDGKKLVFCSSDGYLTFVRFEEGALGDELPRENVPLEVQQAFPYVYDYEYEPPAPKQQHLLQQHQEKIPHETSPPTSAAGSKSPPEENRKQLPTPNSDKSHVKKKRRITPMSISSLVSGASSSPASNITTSTTDDKAVSFPSPNTSTSFAASSQGDGMLDVENVEMSAANTSPPGNVSSDATISSDVVVDTTLQKPVNSTSVSKKAKKRIAPTLLNPL